MNFSKPIKNRREMWETTVTSDSGFVIVIKQKRTKKEIEKWIKENGQQNK
jgi:hypothetical protein